MRLLDGRDRADFQAEADSVGIAQPHVGSGLDIPLGPVILAVGEHGLWRRAVEHDRLIEQMGAPVPQWAAAVSRRSSATDGGR